jgi:hypothetical protein
VGNNGTKHNKSGMKVGVKRRHLLSRRSLV